jgi:hypothetical protein
VKFVDGQWTQGANSTLIVGDWQAWVDGDGGWRVRGPDPDNADHYADGEIVLTEDEEIEAGNSVARRKIRARRAKEAARSYIKRMTAKNNPAVSNSAVEMYRSFQGFEPRKIGAFSFGFYIPDHATLVGPALNVMYRSDKNDPSTGKPVKKPIDYIHDHEDGVSVYRCDRAAEGGQVTVPSFIKSVDSLVLLGDCLGFTYEDENGDAIEASPTNPLPELYTIPSGRALLVVQSKAKVLALIFGGRLGVEARGIVY